MLPRPTLVAGWRGSAVLLTIPDSTAAASATVRACGPTVSWLCEIGTTPARLVSPTVGLIPTTPFSFAGHTIEPSVSVPNAAAQKLADAAAPEPELEPQAFRSSTYGLFVSPPAPDQPLVELKPRKFAHSLRFVFPRMTAPAARRFAATVESCEGGLPLSASEPAFVCILSPVSMFPLSRIGMPCNGPRTCPAFRSASSCFAIDSASGFSSRIELTLWSSTLIRAWYFWTSDCAVRPPDDIPAWSCAIVASSSSGAGPAARAVPARASEINVGVAATAAVLPRNFLRSYVCLETMDESSLMLPPYSLPRQRRVRPPGRRLPSRKTGRLRRRNTA